MENNNENNKSAKPESILSRIMKHLGLGDEGKIDQFLKKQIKSMSRTVDTHKRNIENYIFNYEKTIDTLKEKLEDANTELEDAYLNISPTSVDTNAKQDIFASIYWERVTKGEEKVAKIKAEIEEANKTQKKIVEDTQKQIDELNYRINKIK